MHSSSLTVSGALKSTPPHPCGAPAPASTRGGPGPLLLGGRPQPGPRARLRARLRLLGDTSRVLGFWHVSGTRPPFQLPASGGSQRRSSLLRPSIAGRHREALLGERIWRLRRIFGGTWRGGGATRPCGRGAVGPALLVCGGTPRSNFEPCELVLFRRLGRAWGSF